MRWKTTVGMAAVGAALALAGCGQRNQPTTSAAGGPGNATTVSSRDVPGIGTALTGQNGRTLYFADQEAGGSIRCTDACLRFWLPVTVPAGQTPTAGPGVTGMLATVKRPDGTAQVTYDGKPLYTFAEDKAPGDAQGNGFRDSFSGTDFLWHAAAVSGAAPSAAASDNGYGNGYGNGY